MVRIMTVIIYVDMVRIMTVMIYVDRITIMTVIIICVVDVVQDHSSSHDP